MTIKAWHLEVRPALKQLRDVLWRLPDREGLVADPQGKTPTGSALITLMNEFEDELYKHVRHN